MKTRRWQILLLIALVSLVPIAVTYYRLTAQTPAVLEQMQAVDRCLTDNNQQRGRSLTETMYYLEKAVSDNRYQSRDMHVLRLGQGITQRSHSLTDTLQQVRKQLRQAAGESVAGPLQHPASVIKPDVTQNMQLIRQLDRYQAFIRSYVPNFEMADAAWLTAEKPPLAAALARLTDLETQVRLVASEALQYQAAKIGGSCGFDVIRPMSIDKSFTVAPGAVYEATLFMTHSIDRFKLSMSANGKPLAMQPNGDGLVEFRVPPLRPGQPDTVRAQWRGAVRVSTFSHDTTWHLTVPYLIVKNHQP